MAQPVCHHLPSLIDSWTGEVDLGQWVSRFLLPDLGDPCYDPERPSTVDNGDPADGKSDTLASMSAHTGRFLKIIGTISKSYIRFQNCWQPSTPGM